jgi:hypothetical protein
VERTIEVALYEASVDIADRLKKRSGHLTVAQREEHLGAYRFQVAKALRGVPGADEAFAIDHECIRKGIEYIADELEIDAYALMLAVENVWDKVRRPGTALSRALQLADKYPVTLRGSLARRGARFRRFVGMVYWRQREQPDQVMPLPCKAIGKLLGIGWSTAREYLEALVRPEMGMLRVESALYTYKAGKRTAKTYSFNFDCPHYTPPKVEEEGT